jgi:hypothetical protein
VGAGLKEKKMKATILGTDLIKLISKHGEKDVQMCISMKDGRDIIVDVKCIDEFETNYCGKSPSAFEIYGEEQ